ncbi:MAG TPA: AMP-binding protein [Stellaceae bacterium]|nr:AMP-binding protein [Stellaceae bacterium]
MSAAAFLADAAALADGLPSHRHVVNLCTDRYRFTVGLAAALMREQVSLLPPNEAPATLDQLAEEFPDLYCLYEGAPPATQVATLAFPTERQASAAPIMAVPAFPSQQQAVVLFTSGSTGRPMPYPRLWGALVRGSHAAGTRLGAASLAGATVIGTVPHQHSYGIESAIMLALQHGLAFESERPFYPADVLACLAAAARPRILITTPIHLRAVLADEAPAPKLDLVVSATAPLSPQLAAATEQRFQCRMLEIYGCSEAGQIAVRRPTESEAWECLETIRLRQNEAGTWALDADAGGGEFLLNDVIELRGDGRFLLHGRMADLVNIAGKRTSLSHLDYHLNAIPGVADGVFVMPEEQDGGTARLIAFAVAPDLSARAILAGLRQRIDPAFLPRPLVLVDALPRNALGKLPREIIRRLAEERDR